MWKEVFNRREVKYMLSEKEFEKLSARLKDFIEEDAFNRENGLYTICNIYYDTFDDYLIKHSLSKPAYKEKLRLRGYGIPSPLDCVYLEIKKKYKGKVNKRRTPIRLKDACFYFETGCWPEMEYSVNVQVLREIEYMVNTYQLKPKVYLAYDRMAYFASEHKGLRITFDTNIRCRRHNLRLDDGDYGGLLLGEGYRLMEIKAEHAMPIWLGRMLAEEKIYPVSFSKYGTEYQVYLHDQYERNGMNPCLIQYLNLFSEAAPAQPSSILEVLY